MPRVMRVREALALSVVGAVGILVGLGVLMALCAETPAEAQARHRATCERRGAELAAVMAGPGGDTAVCRPVWGGK